MIHPLAIQYGCALLFPAVGSLLPPAFPSFCHFRFRRTVFQSLDSRGGKQGYEPNEGILYGLRACACGGGSRVSRALLV